MSIQYKVITFKLIIIYVGRTFKMQFVEKGILTYISYFSTHVLYNWGKLICDAHNIKANYHCKHQDLPFKVFHGCI